VTVDADGAVQQQAAASRPRAIPSRGRTRLPAGAPAEVGAAAPRDRGHPFHSTASRKPWGFGPRPLSGSSTVRGPRELPISSGLVPFAARYGRAFMRHYTTASDRAGQAFNDFARPPTGGHFKPVVLPEPAAGHPWRAPQGPSSALLHLAPVGGIVSRSTAFRAAWQGIPGGQGTGGGCRGEGRTAGSPTVEAEI